MIDYTFILNGIADEKFQPKELEALEIVADFDDTAQPSISASELTFINEGADVVNKYIDGGLNGSTRGIFEGIPYEIQLLGTLPPYNAFKGFLDLLQIKRQCDQVTVKLVGDQSLNTFSERCQATTFGYLESIGLFPQSSQVPVPYVINYIPDGVQLITVGISLYLISKEVYDAVPKLIQYVIDLVLAAIPTVGLGVTIDVGNILIQVIKLILLLVYVILLCIAIIKLIKTLFEEIYSIKRYHKACKLKILLTQACSYLGYGFNSSVFNSPSPFENIVYLPVKDKKGQINPAGSDSGIPNSMGYGYTVYEMFELVQKMFKAKLLIKNGIVNLEPKANLSFWKLNSSYVLPDIETLVHEYNTDELNPNYIIKFGYDISDINTIDNFTGTNFERITSPLLINNQQHLKFGGLDEIELNVGLATRKDSINVMETILQALAQVVDTITGLFGSGSNFANGFLNRIGSMNVSSHFGWQPKVLLLDSTGYIPVNHRTYLCAKYLYYNYHYIDSFVANNYGGQFTIYKDITIPFCFHDFLQTYQSSYFTTVNGLVGKFDKITWNFTQMYAKVDYRIQTPYTKNLQESFIEP